MDSKTQDALNYAQAVTDSAQRKRERLRRSTKPGNDAREDELAAVINLLRDAMSPIRSAIGRLPYRPLPERDERRLREASAKLKYERKQIRKMQRR